MGKRAPKIEKEEKTEKVGRPGRAKKAEISEEPAVVEKAETTSKKQSKDNVPAPAPAEEAQFEVFSPKFYQALESFKNFYSEVLALKSKEHGTDLLGEFSEVSKRVSDKLEQQSNKILHAELADLEGWVVEQQDQLASDAKKIEQAYKQNAQALNSTGSFSDEEIRKNLLPIQAKIDEKHNAFAEYGELLKRSKAVYE